MFRRYLGRVAVAVRTTNRRAEAQPGHRPTVRFGPPAFARGFVYGLALAVVLWGVLAAIAFGVYSLAR